MSTLSARRTNARRLGSVCLLTALLLAAPRLEAAPPSGKPGEVHCRPTWCCVGVNWYVAGAGDLDRRVEVAFRRKGTTPWREALGLWAHNFQGRMMFSGSVFRLAPGTEYEFRLTMPATGGKPAVVRTVTARTLDYPRMPARTVPVPAGGLAAAQDKAEPGTAMLLAEGTYKGITLSKSGKPGAWIVYRPAPGAKVVIQGRTEIRADYVWLHGLTLRDPKNAVQGSHKGVCITACRIESHYAIHTARGGENYFIADNVLAGDAKEDFSFSGEGVDFGSGRGNCGHAVCYNEITDFADGVSYGRGDIDVYGNYIHETVDDFIEPDYGYENYRIWGNRCYNSMCGFSFQPMKGGPWYMFRNVNVGAYLHAFKLKDVTGATVVAHNTVLTKTSRLGQGADILRGWILNNAWFRGTPGPLASGGRFRPELNGARVDYNAYGTGGGEPWSGVNYKALAAKHGWDTHSVYAGYRDVFEDDVALPAGTPYYSSKLTGKPIPKDWHFGHYLLRPKAGSKLIDAGTVLPNLTGPYLGKAPDLGAHERGLGTAWYGPRVWDDKTGLVYGLPKGWTSVPLVRARLEAAGIRLTAGTRGRLFLTCAEPVVRAALEFLPMAGEVRWRAAREFVASDAGALTPVLEFQDGLYVRLYEKGAGATLLAGRVETAGVLKASVACSKADLPKARLGMFQLVRSLVR